MVCLFSIYSIDWLIDWSFAKQKTEKIDSNRWDKQNTKKHLFLKGFSLCFCLNRIAIDNIKKHFRKISKISEKHPNFVVVVEFLKKLKIECFFSVHVYVGVLVFIISVIVKWMNSESKTNDDDDHSSYVIINLDHDHHHQWFRRFKWKKPKIQTRSMIKMTMMMMIMVVGKLLWYLYIRMPN